MGEKATIGDNEVKIFFSTVIIWFTILESYLAIQILISYVQILRKRKWDPGKIIKIFS